VTGTEAEGRAARVQVVPVVVVEGDAEVALVFVAVAVRVADQRGLPVVVDEGVGDGYVVGGVGELVVLVHNIWIGIRGCIHQRGHRSSPCRGHGQKRRRSGRSRRWWIFLFH